MVSLANNHTLDRGKNAIVNSINYWKSKENVLTSGSYLSEEEWKRLIDDEKGDK